MSRTQTHAAMNDAPLPDDGPPAPSEGLPASAVRETHQTQHSPQSQRKVEELPLWNVVLLDDDHHSYEYVIEMMMRVFRHPLEQGFKIAQRVDTDKRAVCLTAHKELAELKRDQIHGFGRDARIASCQGSMSAVIEPAFADGDQ